MKAIQGLYTPKSKEPWEPSITCDVFVILGPIVVFILSTMYNYSFGVVCNTQLMLGSELRNTTISPDEEGVIEPRTFLSTGIGYSDCQGTAISTSVMYVLEEYAASAFFPSIRYLMGFR